MEIKEINVDSWKGTEGGCTQLARRNLEGSIVLVQYMHLHSSGSTNLQIACHQSIAVWLCSLPAKKLSGSKCKALWNGRWL